MADLNHIRWEKDGLVLLDQTLLPLKKVYEKFTTVGGVREAIKTMKVRGAPAIGIAAAYGLYLGIKDVPDHCSFEVFYRLLEEKAGYPHARPTAVNLPWGLKG